MTSRQHALWITRGKPMKVARPLAALRDRLRRYGYTVYDLGDTGHLDHQPPEDHTPYSETGWPGTTPYGWVTAIDIMPPPARLRLPSLPVLAGQIFKDMTAGLKDVSWLKYMNWGPIDDRHAVHDQWQPNHVRRSSSDVGHTHISGRSDMTQSTVGDNYDPVARIRNPTPIPPAPQEDEDIMAFLIQYKSPAGVVQPPVFLSENSVIARWISDAEELGDLRTLSGEGLIKVANTTPRVVTRKSLIGRIVGPVPQGFEDLGQAPVTSVAVKGS